MPLNRKITYQLLMLCLLLTGHSNVMAAPANMQPAKAESADLPASAKPNLAAIQPQLITPTEEDTSVTCSLGRLIVKKGSIVSFYNNPDAPAIFNLFSEDGGVQFVSTGAAPIKIPLGSELLLTRSNADLKSLQPPVGFVCHNAADISLGDGIRRFSTEFSSLAAFLAIPELRNKLSSSKPGDRELIGKIRSVNHPQTPPYADFLVLFEKGARTIHTTFGDIICAANTAVYLCITDKSVAVFVLDEKKGDDVKISLGSNFVPVHTSEEVVVTNLSNSNFADINPKTGIYYRPPGAAKQVGDRYVYKTEFRIQKAAAEITAIRNLSKSTDPNRRKMLDRILKNAVIQHPAPMS